jgi:TBC1 domain family protein 5
MVNILFIWSKENKDISYKQGMNELLAVLLFGIYPYYFQNPYRCNGDTIINYIKTDKEKYYKEIYYFFHDTDEIQGDLYFLFDGIMNKGIKELFETGNKKRDMKKFELFQQQWTEEEELEKDQMPLQKRCYLIIKEKLKIIDEELYNHFIKIDLNCTIFLQ